ncbi:MAG: dihydroorotase [Eubacterium sp.]
MKILIKNGRLLDPATSTDAKCDLLIENGRVSKREEEINEDAERIIDASGCYVMPGLIDMHVHLREPGYEYKETIATGTAAALNGGFTTICAMPNTNPTIDSPERVSFLMDKISKEANVNVLPVGAITIGQNGNEITNIAGMKDVGICAISEDGKSVMDVELYRQAMLEAAKADIPVLAHCEDINLADGGVINAGEKSEEFNLPGITNEVEDIIAARDIQIAAETRAKLHLCHCSTKGSVGLIKVAKENGLPVTAEVCPHHFVLSTDCMDEPAPNYKMNPPIRSKEDKEALLIGLKEDIIDVIATDHAPHSFEEKNRSMLEAPFGIVGLETAVALTITYLVEPGIITPMQMAEKMSYNPARILGIDKGDLAIGSIADITIINPEAEYIIDAESFKSKGRNTPFNGMKVRGRIVDVILGETIDE